MFTGPKSNYPDYLATVDLDAKSKTYGKIISRFSMPESGDELHHYGWNVCSSCYGERDRRYLIIPGLASGDIYIVDAADPVQIRLHKTISGMGLPQRLTWKRHTLSIAVRTV